MLKNKYQINIEILLCLLAPLSAFIIGQFVYTSSFSIYSFGVILINYIAISAILWLLVFLTNKYGLAIILLHLIMFIYGAINYFVVYFRFTPVLPWDLKALNTAMHVVGTYTFKPTIAMIISLIYIVLISYFIYKKFNKRSFLFKKDNLASRLVALMISLLCLFIISNPKRVESYGAKTDVWNQASAYKKGGILPVFIANMQFLNIDVPSNYSKYKVIDILDNSEYKNEVSDTKPDIIVIMNESWADLNEYGNLKYSQNTLEKTKSIENIYFNYVYTSVMGAGTSASEFEFLTGFNMAFLPSGSIPYQQYILNNTSSLASILKEAGYSTHAFHPGDKTSWNRQNAYPLLGFDTFKSKLDMQTDIIESHSGYVSDTSNFNELIYDYENRDTSKPYFYFNVSIANHGGYNDETYPNTVKVKGYENKFTMAEEYLTLVKETDEAFYDLIEYFKTVDRPVIVMMFGDHKPALEEEFYDLFYNHGDKVSMKEYLDKFKTPYVLWSNYDLGDIDIGKVSLNFLGQHLLKYAQVELDDYNKYLLDLNKKIEAVSFPGYFASKKAYSHLENNRYTELINEYKMVQYYKLFDENQSK